jgi:TPR repeat protein
MLGEYAAMYHVGCCYRDGVGTCVDYRKAVMWFRKGAECGGADSMTAMGYAYVTGQGVAEDVAAGLRWWRKGAEKNSADGLFYWGWAVSRGLVPEDGSTAIEWYRKAAACGSELAMERLIAAYESGDGVPRSPQEAARLRQVLGLVRDPSRMKWRV